MLPVEIGSMSLIKDYKLNCDQNFSSAYRFINTIDMRNAIKIRIETISRVSSLITKANQNRRANITKAPSARVAN